MGKYQYEKRYETKLKLSERQLEKISAIKVANLFMDRNHLKDLPEINPSWIEMMRFKEIGIGHPEQLKKEGFIDYGRYKIRKTRKGYVLEAKSQFRSKGLETTQLKCFRCNKLRTLNNNQFCKKCTEEVGGSKGITRWIRRWFDGKEKRKGEYISSDW